MKTKLLLYLAGIDALITGNTRGSVMHAVQISDTFDMEDFCLHNREYYLSDGGYSRLVFYDTEDLRGQLGLTSNSTENAKKNWEDKVKGMNYLITRIEELCRIFRSQ